MVAGSERSHDLHGGVFQADLSVTVNVALGHCENKLASVTISRRKMPMRSAELFPEGAEAWLCFYK